MNRFAAYLLGLSLLGHAAQACTVFPMSEDEKAAAARAERETSLSAVTGKDCSFKNGGILEVQGGPAIKLGNERFYQVLWELDGAPRDILVTDCGGREVIRLIGGFIQNENYSMDSCGGQQGDRYAIIAPQGPLTLSEGASFAEFKTIARAAEGVGVDEGLTKFFYGREGAKITPRDEVDFLCGCRLFYPESKGARS